MGKALRDGYRDKVFLMTKIDARSKKAAEEQLNQSLRRLRVDCIDLVQHHETIRFEDPPMVFDRGGANAALLEAREAGKVRYIGFTGHKDPQVHLRMLEEADRRGFHFDTVQMPLNLMDAHFRSFEQLVLPELLRREIGVLGMKSMGDGYLLKSGAVTAEQCLHYALSLPASVVITGIDSMAVLEQALRVGRGFTPLSEEARERLLAKTRRLAGGGEFEPYKTTAIFDATAHNRQWLAQEPEHFHDLRPA